MKKTAQQARAAIPGVASLQRNEQRLAEFWKLTTAERVAMAQQGRLTLGEMLRWAARHPDEVPLVDGEFFFITGLLADSDEGSDS